MMGKDGDETKSRNVGFVIFDTFEAAKAAVETLNNTVSSYCKGCRFCSLRMMTRLEILRARMILSILFVM